MNVYALRERLAELNRQRALCVDAAAQVSVLFAFSVELVDALAELNREVAEQRAKIVDLRQSLANVTGRRAA